MTDRGPTPREHELPNGDLAVSSHWVWGVRGATTVPAADRELYRLLVNVLGDVKVPDLMPARLAAGCEDLVDVKRAVEDIDRGSADIGGAGYGMGYCSRVRDAIVEHRDRAPLHLGAVGCSGSKWEDDGPLPAKFRYKGSYWSGKRSYGEEVVDEWRVISAEHAVLHPEAAIDYYETTPGDLEGVPVDSDERLPNGDAVTTLLDCWALDVHDQLAAWVHSVAGGPDPRDVELDVLLGRDYRDPLETRGVFEALRGPGDLTVSFPFQEEPGAQGGMIDQIGWMNDRADAARTVATDGGDPDA